MKTEQEQIEEMEKDLEQAKYWAMGTVGSLNRGFGGWYGAYMYNQGYRKASDVIDEFESRLSKSLACQTGKFGLADLQYVIAEMRQEVEK